MLLTFTHFKTFSKLEILILFNAPIIRYKKDAKNPQYEYSPVYKNANLLNQMVNKPHSDSNIVQQLFSKYLK